VCLKEGGVNTGEVKQEANIIIGKGFSSPESTESCSVSQGEHAGKVGAGRDVIMTANGDN